MRLDRSSSDSFGATAAAVIRRRHAHLQINRVRLLPGAASRWARIPDRHAAAGTSSVETDRSVLRRTVARTALAHARSPQPLRARVAVACTSVTDTTVAAFAPPLLLPLVVVLLLQQYRAAHWPPCLFPRRTKPLSRGPWYVRISRPLLLSPQQREQPCQQQRQLQKQL